MRPIELELHGFLSFREQTTVPFEGVHAAAIIGENGAGKTSLVEAIGWALYGKGRGRGPDDFVSADAMAATVRFRFELGHDTYTVVRGRERGKRSYLELTELGPEDVWLPVGGDTIAETERAIAELLGMSYDTWTATAYIGQGKADSFTQATPATRKALLGDILELDQYEGLHERARERARRLGGQLEELERRQKELAAVIADTPDPDLGLAAAQQERARIAQEASEALGELRSARDGLRAAEAAAEAVAAARNEEKRLVGFLSRVGNELLALADTTDLLERQANEQAPTADLEARLLTLDTELTAARDELAQRAAAGIQLVEQEEAQAARIAEVTETREALEEAEAFCPTCQQAIDGATRARLIDTMARELARLTAGKDELATEREKVRNQHAAIDAQIRNHEVNRAGLREKLEGARRVETAAAIARTKLEDIHRRQAMMQAEGEQAEEALARVKAQLESADGEPIGKLEVRVRELEIRQHELEAAGQEAAAEEATRQVARNNLREAQAALSKAEARSRDLASIYGAMTVLAEAFGRDGIPAILIDTAVPAIETEANTLLDKLTAGRFQVELRSQRAARADSRLRETLDVIVGDEVSERPIEALSGGERQCVDLSLRIALARTLAGRAGRRIETLVIDEGFTALDATHRQRTIEILHGLLEEFPTVLFVTHLDELADAFPTRIRIARGGAGSTIDLEGGPT